MPNRLIAHLAHVEVLSPKPEESLRFYRDVLGLEESGREGGSVYLRAWGEWDHHSLKLTESDEPGLVHIGWRMLSPQHLERAIAQVEEAGAGDRLERRLRRPRPRLPVPRPGRPGPRALLRGRALAGAAGDGLALSRTARRRYVPRGIAPRHDRPRDGHDDEPARTTPSWYRDALGYRFTEYTVLADAEVPVFAMVTNNEKSHDLGLILDQSGVPGPAAPRRLLGRLARRAPARGRHPARRRHPDRVRSRPPRHGRAGLPLLRASPAACASRSTRAATASTCPTGRPSAGSRRRARTSSTATSRCPTR